MDVLLFMFGGCIAAISFPLFFPRGRRKELNRPESGGREHSRQGIRAAAVGELDHRGRHRGLGPLLVHHLQKLTAPT
jgi:hypothetical protein